MSTAAATSFARCNNFNNTCTWLLNHFPTDYNDEDLLFYCLHAHTFLRNALKPVCAIALKGNVFALSQSQAIELLESKCDRIFIKEIGEGAGSSSSTNKHSGSLIDAISSQIDIDIKRRKSSNNTNPLKNDFNSLSEFIELFCGNRVNEFFTKFFAHSFITTHNDKRPEEKIKFLADLLQTFCTNWCSVLRSSPTQKLSENSQSEYLEILFHESLTIQKLSRFVMVARKGNANKTNMQQMAIDEANKHSSLRNTMQIFFASMANGHSHSHAGSKMHDHKKSQVEDYSAYAENADANVRMCAALSLYPSAASASSSSSSSPSSTASCVEGSISENDKYVQIRCENGCIQSMHRTCFQSIQSKLESDEEGRLKCPNHHHAPIAQQSGNKNDKDKAAATAQGCQGHIYAIIMKKQQKNLATVFGVENFAALSEDESKSQESGASALDASLSDCVANAEIRNALVLRHKLRPLKFVLLSQLQNEAERAADAKRKKMEQEAKEMDEKMEKEKNQASSSSDSSRSTSPHVTKKKTKKNVFEVVVPFTKPSVPSPPSAASSAVTHAPPAPIESRWKSPSSSSSSSLSADSALSASFKNSFNSLNLDENNDDSEWQSVKSNKTSTKKGWNNVTASSFASAVVDSPPLEPQSLFPVTVKKKQGKLKNRSNKEELEEQRLLDEALARSLLDNKPQPIAMPMAKPMAVAIAAPQPLVSVAAAESVSSILFPKKEKLAVNSNVDFPALLSPASSVASSSSASSSNGNLAAQTPPPPTSVKNAFGGLDILRAGHIAAPVPVANIPSFQSPFAVGNQTPSLSAEGHENERMEGEEPGSESSSPPPANQDNERASPLQQMQQQQQQQQQQHQQSSAQLSHDSPPLMFQTPMTAVAMPMAIAMPSALHPISLPSPTPTFTASLHHNHGSNGSMPMVAPQPTQLRSNPVNSFNPMVQIPQQAQLPASYFANSMVAPPAPAAAPIAAPAGDFNLPSSSSMPVVPLVAPILSPLNRMNNLTPSLPTPTGTPAAQPAAPAAPAASHPQLHLCHSVTLSPNNTPTPVIVIPSLPTSILPQQLGLLFSNFGRLNVKLFLTHTSGLNAVLSYGSVEHATNALNAYNQKTFQIDLVSEGDMDFYQMEIQFGAFPLDVRRQAKSNLLLCEQ